MRVGIVLASLASSSLFFGGAAVAVNSQSSAQSKACWAKADAQSLTGAARTDFHMTCMKGAAIPPGPAANSHQGTAWAQAVTAPSGQDRADRSALCSAEADRRGLVSSKRESFRLACLASAAPVRAVGSNTQLPAPSHGNENVDHGGNPAPQ